jgi:uncharacterized protein YceK
MRAGMLLLTLGLLMSGCGAVAPSAATDATCDALRASLPTWSTQDTDQSRIEAAAFLDVFEAACGG